VIQLNHIALLVRSARSGAGLLKKYGLVTGPLQTWEGEGTLEVYAGEESLSARLLLMEAVKSGAYARALEKRGPGLHHLAVDVPDLGSYIAGLSGSGWLLQPASLKTAGQTKTAYLARPGMPLLIEVQEREQISLAPPLVERLELALPQNGPALLAALGLGGSTQIASGKPALCLTGGKVVDLTEFLDQ